MYSETVSLQDVLSIIRGSRRQAMMAINHEYIDHEDYLKHMDRELQLKLGNGIAKEIQPSWFSFSRDPNQYNQRSIETWVLTRDQHDAIVMILMKMAQQLKTLEVRIPIYGELDASPIISKGR